MCACIENARLRAHAANTQCRHLEVVGGILPGLIRLGNITSYHFQEGIERKAVCKILEHLRPTAMRMIVSARWRFGFHNINIIKGLLGVTSFVREY